MQQEFKEKLLAYGFELNKTLERFMGNEDLYEKFLKRFVEDGNMEKLKTDYEGGDMEGAFFAAHTLKGVAANLGLDPFLKPLSPLVEKLRTGELDEEAKEYYAKVVDEYENIINLIGQKY